MDKHDPFTPVVLALLLHLHPHACYDVMSLTIFFLFSCSPVVLICVSLALTIYALFMILGLRCLLLSVPRLISMGYVAKMTQLLIVRSEAGLIMGE